MKPSKRTNSAAGSTAQARPRQSLKELDALQRAIAGAVAQPLTSGERMQPLLRKVADRFIKPNSHLSAFERLEIYNRQYWFRLVGCFSDDYPGLRAILGDRIFDELAVRYIDRYPSTSFTLRNLGQYLVQFLIEDANITGERKAAAIEMARLEWAHIKAFDDEAKPALSVDQLLERDPGKLRFRLQPYLSLLEMKYPLDEWLLALRDKGRLRAEASNASEEYDTRAPQKPMRLPARETVHLVVHRHKNTVYYKRLEATQFQLLTLLESGKTLAGALNVIVKNKPAMSLQKWFENWSSLGWFWLP